LKYYFIFNQPNIRAKILGVSLVFFGVYLFYTDFLYSNKLAFASILIGLLLIFLISEKTTSNKISQAQIEGYTNAFKKIIKNLNLNGNAIFLPQSDILSQERIFIPIENKNIKIPEIHNEFVFSTGADGKSLGIALPPSGLMLLKEIEKDEDFKNYNLDNIEERLQIFVGLDLLKSISIRRLNNHFRLIIENPIYCNTSSDLCKQFPCPACSAVIAALTRFLNKKIFVIDVKRNEKKFIFELKIGD